MYLFLKFRLGFTENYESVFKIIWKKVYLKGIMFIFS